LASTIRQGNPNLLWRARFALGSRSGSVGQAPDYPPFGPAHAGAFSSPFLCQQTQYQSQQDADDDAGYCWEVEAGRLPFDPYIVRQPPKKGNTHLRKKPPDIPDPLPFQNRFPPSAYSPMNCKTSLRDLRRVSKSTNTICCQVPRISSPSQNGTVRDGPKSDARTCECPFPSCHLSS